MAALVEPIVLVYEAPQSCPSESEFAGAIERDGGHFTRRPQGDRAREFRVLIAAQREVTGRLVVRDGASTEVVRTIHGDRCDDVVRSLAVSVALALEPERGRPAASSDAVSAAPPGPAEDARATPVPEPDAPQPAPGPEPLPPGWRLGVSAEGTASGVGSMAFGLAAYVEVIRDVPEGLAPALRLGVEAVSGSGGVAVDQTGYANGFAKLSRQVLRADGCPLRLVAARPWSASTFELWGCARFDAGRVSVVDPNQPAPPDTQRAWVAAGAIGHVRWVARRLFFYLEGGAMFPLVRARFVVQPSWTVYEIPAMTGAGGLGVGVFFL
jgi:hypothetical protein